MHPTASPATASTPPGRTSTFDAEVPSAGGYHLFLDFQHDGVVRTARVPVVGDVSRSTPTERSVELAISGMTCASCANRIERKLNKLDGVTATVNYATEKAKVTFAGGVSTDELIAAVEQAGYTAALPGRRPPTRPQPRPTDPTRSLRGPAARLRRC